MSKTYDPITSPGNAFYDMPKTKGKPAQGHTPGPWRVGKSAGFNIASGVFAKSGYHIAEVVDVESGQAEANARLIAAAPDLLAAARLAEARSHQNPDGSYTVDESAMSAICRVIGKLQ